MAYGWPRIGWFPENTQPKERLGASPGHPFNTLRARAVWFIMVVWTEERVGFLQSLWVDTSISTSDIAKRCSERFGVLLLKNAIVGKAHRQFHLFPALWPARASPIKRRDPALPPPPPPRPPAHVITPTLPPLPSERSLFFDRRPPLPTPPPVVVRAVSAARQPPPVLTCERMADRRRADGSGCRRIIGDPRAVFRVCDAPLYSVNEPYCPVCRNECYTSGTSRLSKAEV
jgi:hypothetical protein